MSPLSLLLLARLTSAAGDEACLLQTKRPHEVELRPNSDGPSGPSLGGLWSEGDFLEHYKMVTQDTLTFIDKQLLGTMQLAAKRNMGTCDQGDPTLLLPWEQLLIKDFPAENTSMWGHLCFDTTQGATNPLSQSLFILGMKAVSNFNYDFCKYAFDKLIGTQPDFVLAYWGRAMCESWMLWSTENPATSNKYLEEGRDKQRLLNIELSDREERYYAAAEALNDYNGTSGKCRPGVEESKRCRVMAFLEGNQGLYKSYAWDANTGAYVVLSHIAVGVVECTGFKPGECVYLEGARALAEKLLGDPVYSQNPAFLHYSLHSFDYPYAPIFKRGLQFAERYPRLVNGSVHSLHMPSHIYLRNGFFAAAAAADHASVAAADAFSTGGALRSLGGPVGEDAWSPGEKPSGEGFAFDAGNLYHSLEFEAYEVLQACRQQDAAALVQRMGLAAFQALAAGGGRTTAVQGRDATRLGPAWFNAATYYGWLYRMQARISLQATFWGLLGRVGDAAEPLPFPGFGGIVPASSLPLPLPWEGSSDYSHAVYAPQSEAGLWSAIALEAIFAGGRAGQVIAKALLGSEPASADDQAQGPAEVGAPWGPACGGIPPVAGAMDCTVKMALQRIHEVQQFYLATPNRYNEANLTGVLELQVRSSLALSAGDLPLGMKLAKQASDLEVAAVDVLGPQSSSLYFLPGTAFHGIVALRLASAAGAEAAEGPVQGLDAARVDVDSLLAEAREAFGRCLSPQGRPQLSLCLLGAARVERLLAARGQGGGDAGPARELYGKLMHNWAHGGSGGKAAQQNCDVAWRETVGFLAE